jgi:hypothetical protein
MRRLSDEEIKRLSAEHSELAGQKHEALQKPSHYLMPDSDGNAYEERIKRIGEICNVLAKCGNHAG